ncbi:MAG: hypothetical protein UW64_C0003G0053 [Microgenomates group bacterium GW2011_GWC1_44_37]|uniref:IPT/TIG domain-containing protein n=1 Tax=Candidatus Collierbacteria bacterium GW2011_GWB2_44_22 TaxID=1618387 RepID=A0A0G1HZS6_9BACT|nr:MAG: hypothetical protein UW31_C0005G0052 [Candidatus Collierbacteria bacterium GW2011_GWA2_44_13]KKT51488.1 MAG: hypothetical protein UW42_C0002G0021 [Candidatus Collierbacteria bacterium GW2011_GWB1_44_197]KKT52500.1 MAG: hypothetical protein UW44_C0001G0052 [Candidatus Collierbacteria bacterium GW2011_GWB2_44_22]KKT62723.1 MAG: hypothetical protein UW56_C0004G0036 [Candidatus Collierbacteria bacterium GW2011_GWD1_44_27]KKT69203.1 MAG: hypothetical protein UW64_C0003G0053 [Microgenomates g
MWDNWFVKQKISQLFIRYIFPLILFTIGTYSMLIYLKAGEFGATNLDVRTLDQMVASRSGELLKGDKVWGTFHSRYTNLGIVSLRFYNQNRDSKDTLVFRLKEQGQDKWYYEAKYETDQFLPHKHFPFGFPVIPNSDGKDYEFQLESLRGATGSGIFLDYQTPPVFTAKSFFPKAELLSDRRLLTRFSIDKLSNIFGDSEIRLNIFVFFLPLLLYLVFLLTDGLSYQYPTLIALSFPFYDVFWLTKSYDFLFLSLLFFWSLVVRRFRFESRIAAVFALSFLVLTPVMLIFGYQVYSEKTAVWAYLFLCITVVQRVYEIKHKPVDLLNLDVFLRKFHQFKVARDYWVRDLPVYAKNFRNFYFATIDKLSLDAIIRSHPEQEKDLIFWLRTIPRLVKEIFLFCIVSILVVILTVFVFYLFILSPVLTIYRVMPKFMVFYPETYLQRYFLTLLIPELIFLVMSFGVFKKVAKKTIYALLLTILAFNLLSGKIVSKSVEFETRPKILTVSPDVTSEAWTDVAVYGKNFRNIPFVGKLYIGDIEQGEYMIYWSDEKIIFRTSPDLTKSGPIKVVPLDRAPSNTVQFNYLFAK